MTRASNGKEALRLAEDILPDIIILDWMMPLLSGIDVCRRLRAVEPTKQISIIILSARGEERDRTLCLDIGANDYISKPFSPKEFISIIKAVLRRSRPAIVTDVLEHKSLQINTAAKTVTRSGVNSQLGPKEFNILLMLIERPGQVFSRTQILDRVWGHGINVGERTIDAHFSRLRKAINTSTDGKKITRTFAHG